MLEPAGAMLTTDRRALAYARGRAGDIWQTVDQLARELPQLDVHAGDEPLHSHPNHQGTAG